MKNVMNKDTIEAYYRKDFNLIVRGAYERNKVDQIRVSILYWYKILRHNHKGRIDTLEHIKEEVLKSESCSDNERYLSKLRNEEIKTLKQSKYLI